MVKSFAATTNNLPPMQHQGQGAFATVAGRRIVQMMQQQQKGPAPVAVAQKLVKG